MKPEQAKKFIQARLKSNLQPFQHTITYRGKLWHSKISVAGFVKEYEFEIIRSLITSRKRKVARQTQNTATDWHVDLAIDRTFQAKLPQIERQIIKTLKTEFNL